LTVLDPSSTQGHSHDAHRKHRLFESGHLQQNLRARSVRGAAATVVSQGMRFLVQLGGMAVLARLLAPVDFGVFAKTIAITGFIAVIRTGGLSVATVQHAEITHRQVSNLFWLNAALGLLSATLVVALSPAIAAFYGDPRVLLLAASLGGVVLISSLGVQHAALMQRQMRFSELAVIGAVSPVAGFSVAILSALAGAGFWALLIQQLVAEATNLVLVLVKCRWRPGLPRRGSGVRPMVKIGAYLSVTNVLSFASRNTDNVLIGRFVSDVALGYYAIAYRLLLLPMQQVNAPVTAVVLPSLSRLQHDPDRYAHFYYRAIGLMVFITMPAACFLLVDARALVLLVIGPQWLPVTAIFQALSVAAFIGTFSAGTGWVFTSLGRTDRQFRWQAVAVPLTIISFVLGLPWGAWGVAVAFSTSQVLMLIPSLRYCYRDTPLSLPSTLATLARPAVAALAASGALWLAQRAVPSWQVAWLPLDALLFGGAYLAAWWILPGGRDYLRRCVGLVRELAPGARRKRDAIDPRD
jgi:O-antigen/teichoic acid export membrane protein